MGEDDEAPIIRLMPSTNVPAGEVWMVAPRVAGESDEAWARKIVRLVNVGSGDAVAGDAGREDGAAGRGEGDA